MEAISEKKEEQWIKISFINPVSNKRDYIFIQDDILREMKNHCEGGLCVISFFYIEGNKSHLITIHVDKDNKVRAQHKSSFFLLSNKKLYPSDMDCLKIKQST
ncbi:MAG: hypothetical protein ACP6IY_06235 [Promethearchaeia archaeon]